MDHEKKNGKICTEVVRGKTKGRGACYAEPESSSRKENYR